MNFDELTEAGQFTLEFRIVTIGVPKVSINEIFLHDKLIREGLAKG